MVFRKVRLSALEKLLFRGSQRDPRLAGKISFLLWRRDNYNAVTCRSVDLLRALHEMKALLPLMLIIGFGFWLNQEIQKEKELQTKLDEMRQALDDAKSQLLALKAQQRPQQQAGFGANAQYSNPLNAPPVRSSGHK